MLVYLWYVWITDYWGMYIELEFTKFRAYLFHIKIIVYGIASPSKRKGIA